MKAIVSQRNFLDELFTEFSSSKRLICIEGTERFEFVDLHHSNMTEKRLKNVLLELIEERREEDCRVNKKSYRPLGRNRARSLITKIIRRVMTHNVVLAAFESVPGWQRGIVTYSNEDVFVRRTMEPVTPVAGDWSNIRLFIETLFGSEQKDEPYAEKQLHAFYCLVQAKLLQMMGEPTDRGSCPLLVLVGAPNTGKSFLGVILAYMLGKRDGALDPSAENNGWTDALLSSPVLFYDEASREELSFSDGRSRGRNAEAFKRMEYSSTATIAARGKTAVKLPVVWLWMRALNTGSRAALLQTPTPTENGMEDKLILTKIYRGVLPLNGKEDIDSRRKRWDIIKPEIAHFAHWLLNDFPNENKRREWLVDGTGQEYRNQVPPFAHPEVVSLLESSENDDTKKNVILKYVMAVPRSYFDWHEFTASDVHAGSLRDKSNQYGLEEGKMLANLFKSAEQIGRILTKLADDPLEKKLTRVSRNNKSYYSLHMPSPQNES